MVRYLILGLALVAASLSGLPVPAAAEDPESPPSDFEKATIWTTTAPGLTLIGARDDGMVVRSDSGHSLINWYDRSTLEIPLPDVTQVVGLDVLFCDRDEVSIFHYRTLETATADELGYDSIIDCMIVNGKFWLLAEVDGTTYLTHRPRFRLTEVTIDLEVPNAARLEPLHPYAGLLIDEDDNAFLLSWTILDPYDGPREPHFGLNSVERVGNAVTERQVYHGAEYEYTLPENATGLMPVWERYGRLYQTVNVEGRAELTSFSIDPEHGNGTRTLELPFVPDRTIAAPAPGYYDEHEDGLYVEKDDTIYVISGLPVLQSAAEIDYVNGSGETVEIEYWSLRSSTYVYIQDHLVSATNQEGGLAFTPPFIKPGTYPVVVEPDNGPLMSLTTSGWLPTSEITIKIPPAPFQSGRSVNAYCRDYNAIDMDFSIHTLDEAAEGTFTVLDGSECHFSHPQASYVGQPEGSWGFYEDGEIHDFLGTRFSFTANGDITFGIRYRPDGERPVWVNAFRSGGHLTPSREVQTICFSGRQRSEETHTISYEDPTRILLDPSRGNECYLVAEEDENSDLTVIWRYEDYSGPIGSARIGIKLNLSRPAWYDIGEMIVHPNDDTTQFVIQQYEDFVGRSPTDYEMSVWTTDIDTGKQPRGALTLNLLESAQFTNVAGPNIRLYQAYFGRLPDAGGLRYWMDLRRDGYSMELVSNQFALSQEFTNTYGDTTDTEFIGLVYENVLERPPDVEGYQYWQDLLTSKQITRGELMIYFSESTEYRNSWAPTAQVVSTFIAMLGRVPTDVELAFELSRIEQGVSASELVQVILGSDEYDRRFWDHYRGPRIHDSRVADALVRAPDGSLDLEDDRILEFRSAQAMWPLATTSN